MTHPEKPDPKAIESLFEDLRREGEDVPEGLALRVLQDARRLQPRPDTKSVPWWRKGGFLAQIGGWPALGGLAAASCFGFWIGIDPPGETFDPAYLISPFSYDIQDDAAELTGFGWDLQEG